MGPLALIELRNGPGATRYVARIENHPLQPAKRLHHVSDRIG